MPINRKGFSISDWIPVTQLEMELNGSNFVTQRVCNLRFSARFLLNVASCAAMFNLTVKLLLPQKTAQTYYFLPNVYLTFEFISVVVKQYRFGSEAFLRLTLGRNWRLLSDQLNKTERRRLVNNRSERNRYLFFSKLSEGDEMNLLQQWLCLAS